MSKIDIQLGDLGENSAIFHDFRYYNQNVGGNSNLSLFELINVSGNQVYVQGRFVEQNPVTKKWETSWRDLHGGDGLDGVRIHITGEWENNEFLRMLQLILETEKMVEIIKP